MVATSALEAGVDFEDVDVVGILGFPGVNSFLQRIGRCGRKSEGLVLFFPGDSPYDSYLFSNPQLLVDMQSRKVIFAELPKMARTHLKCAFAESRLVHTTLFSHQTHARASGSDKSWTRIISPQKATEPALT